MPHIPNEVIDRLSALQSQIWQTVTLSVSEACGTPITFGSALTVSAPNSDLYAEMTAPKLIIQFAFASLPENAQILILPQETFADLANILREEEIETIDENLVADIRPALEGIIQGICLAVGNIRNEPVVASGLSIRFQVLSFPPNLQKSAEILRTNVAITGESINGSAIWLMDSETAHSILGLQQLDEEAGVPFTQVGSGAVAGPVGPSAAALQVEEGSGLEILKDIPLELSVELGRVKMVVRDVVELGAGSIVEIDKAAGEPVDVLVNGRLVARGEVVVIEDNFGVRVTEILSPQERLQRLNEVA
jgi:flagellar motor switch protein FliN/FliY